MGNGSGTLLWSGGSHSIVGILMGLMLYHWWTALYIRPDVCCPPRDGLDPATAVAGGVAAHDGAAGAVAAGAARVAALGAPVLRGGKAGERASWRGSPLPEADMRRPSRGQAVTPPLPCAGRSRRSRRSRPCCHPMPPPSRALCRRSMGSAWRLIFPIPLRAQRG